MPAPVKLGAKAWSAIWFVVVSALMGLLISGLIVPFAAIAGVGAKAGADAMSTLPADLETPPLSQGSTIEMADGTPIATIYAEDRTYVPLDQIAPIMQTAQIAIEDNRFYEHGALDFRGTMRALFVSGGSQGGSTITQQYVKNVQIETAMASGDLDAAQKAQERSLSRKIQELRYAIAMEKRFSKQQILERYLNIAGYGGQVYGVEAAAHKYFNKHAKDLTLPEAAMIAGIVQNPSAFNPAVHPQAATDRRNVVLARMLQLKLISQPDYDKAVATQFDSGNVQDDRNGCVGSKYAQLCQYALEELYQQTPSLGNTQDDRQNNISRADMTIKLSVDPKVQDLSQGAIASVVSPTDPVIATFAMVQPGTGKILSMAQSRPDRGTDPGQTYWIYNADPDMGGAEGYQAGSTFKIFTSANALDSGVSPTKTFVATSGLEYRGKSFVGCDGPFTLAESYHPQNDGQENYGAVDMYKAAQLSINSYYLQLEQSTSICGVAKMGDAAGVDVTQTRNDGTRKTLSDDFSTAPSLTLGPVEVSPLSMANAYATFAARGVHCDTSIVASITSRDGKLIATKPNNCQQVIKQTTADAVNRVFSTVVSDPQGSGHGTQVPGYDQAGKTGTTDTQGTVWFDGYTPDFAASSMITVDKTDPMWQNRQQSIANLTLKTGVKLTGFGAPDCTQYFKKVMQGVLPTGPNTKFTAPPSDVLNGKQVTIPKITGTDPNADEATLKAAGFQTARIHVSSNAPKDTYLGIDKQGQATQGSLINLIFSSGPAQPTQAPTQAPTDQPTQPTQAPTTQKS